MSNTTVELFGDVIVAHTPDEVTGDSFGGFLDALSVPLAEGRSRVVLHMDRSDTFDSAGLEGVLDLNDRVREAGGGMKISGLGQTGRTVFNITRLDRELDVFESVIDAVASFSH